MIWTCLSLVISLSFTLSSLFLHKLIGNFELQCSLGTLSIRFPFFPLTGDHRQWYCCSQAPFQHGSPPQWACDTGPSLWQRGPKWCLSWPFLVEFRSPQGTLGMSIGCHRKCREVCRWKDAKTPAKTQNKSFFFHKLRRSMQCARCKKHVQLDVHWNCYRVEPQRFAMRVRSSYQLNFPSLIMWSSVFVHELYKHLFPREATIQWLHEATVSWSPSLHSASQMGQFLMLFVCLMALRHCIELVCFPDLSPWHTADEKDPAPLYIWHRYSNHSGFNRISTIQLAEICDKPGPFLVCSRCSGHVELFLALVLPFIAGLGFIHKWIHVFLYNYKAKVVLIHPKWLKH